MGVASIILPVSYDKNGFYLFKSTPAYASQNYVRQKLKSISISKCVWHVSDKYMLTEIKKRKIIYLLFYYNHSFSV